MSIVERTKMVCAMEFIARQINDEDVFYPWLSVGVADGDIKYGDMNSDGAEDYCDDETFAELMSVFLRRMVGAAKSGGLYCDGIVSDDTGYEEEEE